MFIEHDLAGPRSHLRPNVVTPLLLCASICLFLTISPLATAGSQTLKKKTSKLKISVLTDVITNFNMPVNIDEGEQ